MYETADYYIATVLSASGFEIEHVNRTNPARVVFIFTGDKKEITDTVDLFWLKKIELNAHDIFEAQRYLKSLIYNDSA